MNTITKLTDILDNSKMFQTCWRIRTERYLAARELNALYDDSEQSQEEEEYMAMSLG